jgi:membrane fusion protein, heavy metal efflux system
LAIVEIRAPISGTVEQLTLANSERVNAEESLLVLADTRVLWVEAQLRESQWRAISLRPNDPLRVTTPAFDEQLEASVNFVGRSVDAMTNSIPIVATVYNDGRLRPGLFVNVELPLGEKRSCLVVPEAAVAIHEGQSFVFTPLKENLFERRDVKTGQQVNGWIEITSGLEEGEEIVVEGGFFLKSELLLEAEE